MCWSNNCFGFETQTSDSAKLDLILSRLGALDTKFDGLLLTFGELSTKVDALQTTVDDHKESIAAIRAELDTNKAEMRAIKTSHNAREQRLRSNTLRVFNIPYSDGESADNFKPLAAKIYDRILRPTMVAAKNSGDIGAVPQQATIIEACFRAFTPSSHPADAARPPPGVRPPPLLQSSFASLPTPIRGL